MVDKDTFKSSDIVLLVKHQHGFLVIDGINRPEGNWAIPVSDENTIADNTGSTFIAVGKCLNIT